MCAQDSAGQRKSGAEAEAEANEQAKEPRFFVEIFRDWCKGCGICAAFCPQEALRMNDRGEPEVARPELCSGCAWCELRCPDFAISVSKKDKDRSETCES